MSKNADIDCLLSKAWTGQNKLLLHKHITELLLDAEAERDCVHMIINKEAGDFSIPSLLFQRE